MLTTSLGRLRPGRFIYPPGDAEEETGQAALEDPGPETEPLAVEGPPENAENLLPN